MSRALLIALAAAALAVAGCSTKKERVGLDLHNIVGEWEHVATMHNYHDNYAACLDIAEVLTAKWGRVYRCRVLP